MRPRTNGSITTRMTVRGMMRGACAIGMSCAIALLGMSLTACSNDTNAANDTQQQDWSTAVAATVDGHDITEADVNDYIDGYRKAYGLVTDAQWATFLDEQSSTANAYREAAIRQLAERYVVNQIADDEGISVTDDEIDSAVSDAKAQAGYADDDAGWDTFLSSIGKDADSYRNDVRLTLLVRKYAETHASVQTPSEAQMRSYASTDTAKYTGKRVVSVSFKRSADATAAKKELSGIDITMDTVSTVASGHDGTVSSLGWTGLSDMTSACTTAIADLSAGQTSDVTHDDGKYVIYYVAQEFKAGSDGSIDVGSMPKELYDTLRSDVSTSINADAMQSCLDELLDEHELSISDMPSGLPYDIDIKANSTYSATNTNMENANATDASTDDGSATTADNGSNQE